MRWHEVCKLQALHAPNLVYLYLDCTGLVHVAPFQMRHDLNGTKTRQAWLVGKHISHSTTRVPLSARWRSSSTKARYACCKASTPRATLCATTCWYIHPGATRFYRSEQGLATQQVKAHVGDGARLEWLPLETIAYNGCHGLNHAVFDLAPTAEMMAWDITALGLPNANLPFERGQLQQHMEVSGVWLERGLIDAQDARLMDGPLGLAKHRCMATLVFACGADLPRDRRDLALSLARELTEAAPAGLVAGVTSPHPRMVVLRTLSPLVEPAQNLLRGVWAAWRRGLWAMSDRPPRIWSM